MVLINKIYGLAVGATAISGSGAVMSYLSKTPETVKEITKEKLTEQVDPIEKARDYIRDKYKNSDKVKSKWDEYKDLDFRVFI